MTAFFAGQDLPAGQLITATEKILKRGRRTTSSTTTTTSVGVLRLDDLPIDAGYSCLITATVHPSSTVANDRVLTTIRHTTDGSTPSTSSPILPGGYALASITATNATITKAILTEYEPAADETLSLLVCVERVSGSGSVSLGASSTQITEIRVYNSGPAVGDSGVDI